MGKFLIGLVTGVILTVLLAVIVVFAAAKFGTEKRVVIQPNSTLLLELEGEIPERPPVEFPIPFLDRQTPSTVKDVREMLRKAAVDSRIKAVVLQPRNLDVGWAKLEELRSDLEQFRKSG